MAGLSAVRPAPAMRSQSHGRAASPHARRRRRAGALCAFVLALAVLLAALLQPAGAHDTDHSDHDCSGTTCNSHTHYDNYHYDDFSARWADGDVTMPEILHEATLTAGASGTNVGFVGGTTGYGSLSDDDFQLHGSNTRIRQILTQTEDDAVILQLSGLNKADGSGLANTDPEAIAAVEDLVLYLWAGDSKEFRVALKEDRNPDRNSRGDFTWLIRDSAIPNYRDLKQWQHAPDPHRPRASRRPQLVPDGRRHRPSQVR